MLKTTAKLTAYSSRLLTDGIYNINIAPKVIMMHRIESGQMPEDTPIGYLRASDKHKVWIPTEVREYTGLLNSFVERKIGNKIYLIHPKFRGNLKDVEFHTFPQFPIASMPNENFFVEANEIHSTESYNKMSLYKYIPTEYYSISYFYSGSRRWLEVRPIQNKNERNTFTFGSINEFSTVYIPSEANRLHRKIMQDIPNGLTISSNQRPFLNPQIEAFLESSRMICWISKTRNALIVEATPIDCSICGKKIYSTDEKFHIHTCNGCTPNLGPEGKINALRESLKLIDSLYEALDEH